VEHIDISKLPQPSDPGHWLYKRLKEVTKGRQPEVAGMIGVSQSTVNRVVNCKLRSRTTWAGLVAFYLECLAVELEVKKYDQSINA
jgi:hypothetical protein